MGKAVKKRIKKTIAPKPLRIREVKLKPSEVIRVIPAHKDIVHQAVVHKDEAIEIVPVLRPKVPLKKPSGWWEYLFGDAKDWNSLTASPGKDHGEGWRSRRPVTPLHPL